MQNVYQAVTDLLNWFQSKAQVGGITKNINITPTVAGGVAYSAGESIGGPIKIDGAGRKGSISNSGIIQSVSFIGGDGDTLGGITIHFFNGNPGGADSGTFDPLDAIMSTKIPGHIVLTTADNLKEFHQRDFLEKTNLGIPFQIITDLYAVIIADEAMTLSENDETQLTLGILQD